MLQIKGNSLFEQDGCSVLLSPGEWAIVDIDKSLKATHPGDIEILSLLAPRETISSKRYDLEQLTMRRYSGTTGFGKLMYDFILSEFDVLATQAITGRESEHNIVGATIDLARRTFRDFAEEHEGTCSPRQVLCARIKSYIESNLSDPQLQVEQIAAALNCSKRYLYAAWEEEEISIARYIWLRRLEHCREDLQNPEYNQLSTTEVAFSWGFNSSSHFCTTFKEQYGTSPHLFRINFATARCN